MKRAITELLLIEDYDALRSYENGMEEDEYQKLFEQAEDLRNVLLFKSKRKLWEVGKQLIL